MSLLSAKGAGLLQRMNEGLDEETAGHWPFYVGNEGLEFWSCVTNTLWFSIVTAKGW